MFSRTIQLAWKLEISVLGLGSCLLSSAIFRERATSASSPLVPSRVIPLRLQCQFHIARVPALHLHAEHHYGLQLYKFVPSHVHLRLVRRMRSSHPSYPLSLIRKLRNRKSQSPRMIETLIWMRIPMVWIQGRSRTTNVGNVGHELSGKKLQFLLASQTRRWRHSQSHRSHCRRWQESLAKHPGQQPEFLQRIGGIFTSPFPCILFQWRSHLRRVNLAFRNLFQNLFQSRSLLHRLLPQLPPSRRSLPSGS
jgi:hypothetical protein